MPLVGTCRAVDKFDFVGNVPQLLLCMLWHGSIPLATVLLLLLLTAAFRSVVLKSEKTHRIIRAFELFLL